MIGRLKVQNNNYNYYPGDGHHEQNTPRTLINFLRGYYYRAVDKNLGDAAVEGCGRVKAHLA